MNPNKLTLYASILQFYEDISLIVVSKLLFIMGKKQHSKDRLFITRTEWNNEWGGYKEKKRHKRQLPFYCCGLTLQPFQHPFCTKDGYVFDLTLNIC